MNRLITSLVQLMLWAPIIYMIVLEYKSRKQKEQFNFQLKWPEGLWITLWILSVIKVTLRITACHLYLSVVFDRFISQ